MSLDSLIQTLSGDLKGYKSIPFWSWNSHLDEDTLVQQIEDMKSVGIGGFIMHARTGLQDDYLGEKWFSCISACLEKAKELEMDAWIYDENGWPSGFVGGKLLENPEYRARFLEYKIGKFDPDAFVSYISVTEGYHRVAQPVRGINEYHNVYLRISPANTDILNPCVVDAFIRETHEEYYRRFPDSFGRELVGFFTDEPQYYRWATAYTPCIEQEFMSWGEDVRDGLIWLFHQDERGYGFRTRYYQTMNRLYTENFYKKIYDWCQAHGCKLTGHSVEESFLAGQMLGGADVMPSYEYEHIPGIDWLARYCPNEMTSKQASSVAQQLGIRQVLTETYGCCGYDVTPWELRAIGQSQYFCGINLMCQHLYPYTLAAGGKRDHPPVFSPHANWFDGFRVFNDYFSRLGYIISNTDEIYDVGILHPIRQIWLDYLRTDDGLSMDSYQHTIDQMMKELRQNGILFQLIDETLLARHGSVENGNLRLGKQEYDSLIIPPMDTLAATSCDLLHQFDGRLLLKGNITRIDGIPAPVNLQSNCSFTEICNRRKVKYSCPDGHSFITARKGEMGEFLFVQNISLTESSKVIMEGAANQYLLLDLEHLSTVPIADEMALRPGEGLVLVKCSDVQPIRQTEEVKDITADFCVANISENYLVLDKAQLSKGEEPFGPVRHISGLFEDLLRSDYRGKITIRQTFVLNEPMPLTLIMEKASLLSAKVNGQPVSFLAGDFDINFVEAEIGGLVHAGENEFAYTIDFYQHEGVSFALFDPLATESLRNCLYFDTTLEAVYLRGDFVVERDFSLSPSNFLPPITTEMNNCGYPFFMGTLTLFGRLSWEGEGQTILGLIGRFMMATLKVNGQKREMVLDDRCDITDLMHIGENDIEIVIRSSLRNLFGPHHFASEPEPVGVTPYHFEMRGEWGDESDSPNYTENYSTVPFGIERIEIVVKKDI